MPASSVAEKCHALLALENHIVELVYAPYRVWCRRCGLRVERVPWADQWQRVTHALARAVASLARELTWSAVAHHFRLNWKTVAAVVEGAVLWGLQHRHWEPLHMIGIDEVSRRKGQQYLTIVYDLGPAGSCGWATIATPPPWSASSRGSAPAGPAIHTVCCDMWSVYIDAVQTHLPHAAIVFDRFHLSRAVEAVRRQTWRQLQGAEKAEFKRTRFLWLKNPENLARDERTRLSGPAPPQQPDRQGVPPQRGSPPLLDLPQYGSHRAYGYRTTGTYIANIYHCCAGLPQP